MVLLGLPACNTFERLSDIGTGPSLGKIEDPQAQPGYKPVNMPMPSAEPASRNPNSLWRNGARAFFKDQRAAKVGDLVTVNVAIDRHAALVSDTGRVRGPNVEHMEVPNLLGYEVAPAGAVSPMQKFLKGIDPAAMVNVGSHSASVGEAHTHNADVIAMTIAASVIQVLPNGNFVVLGKQQVKVNSEVRELTITGIVRPEDITSTNTIEHTQIAEARISYTGKGYVSDVQQPRYGQELMDILLPF